MTTLRRPALVPLALLVLGTTMAAQTDITLRSFTGGRGLTVLGEGGLTNFTDPDPVEGGLGRSVAWADLNGDGADDLVVGAPTLPSAPLSTNLDEAGHVYVVFGDPTAGNPGIDPDIDLTQPVAGRTINFKGRNGDRLGSSVAFAGDVNGDGFDDVILGAPGHKVTGPTNAGGAYVLFGAADFDQLATTVTLGLLISDVSHKAVFLRGASAYSGAGTSVGGGIDANNDGFADVVVGCPLESTNGHMNNGTARVVYGNATLGNSTSIGLGTLGSGQSTIVHGAQDFQLLGWSVAGLGRFDPIQPGGASNLTFGDDVAIGAPGTLNGSAFFAGAAYVLRGVASGTPATSYTSDDFAGEAGSAGVTYLGAALGDQTGWWVGSLGDLTSDGFVELGIASPFDDGSGKADAGSLYVVPGRYFGTNPSSLELADVGVGDGIAVVRILGAATGDGELGISAAPAGDLDNDGALDLAVGFPAATAIVGGMPNVEGGTVQVLTGLLLNPSLIDVIDLGLVSGLVEIMRLTGETAGVRAGYSLAGGDHNADGKIDLAVGASGAPSDPSPSDPTGLVFLSTGRAHVFFGPLSRVGDIDPLETHFEGPEVTLSVFNLDDSAGVTLRIDGDVVVPDSIVAGTPGTITYTVPVPARSSIGTDVDVEVTSLLGDVVHADAVYLQELVILTGPDPSDLVPGTEISFTGLGFSTDADMSVSINGVDAPIVSVDPIAGTLTVTAPVGNPSLVALDMTLDNSNAASPLVLSGAVIYQPFVIDSISPTSGTQSAGVGIPIGSPGYTYFGEPEIPVELSLNVSSGTIDPSAVVEFGSDAIGWREAEFLSAVGSLLTVNLPAFGLGPQDVLVDVRVTLPEGTVSVEDAFTYTATDYFEILATGSPGLGAIPNCQAAGDFTSSGKVLLIVDHAFPFSQAGALFLGVQLFDPPFPAKGGLLGVQQLVTIIVPLTGIPLLPVQFNLPVSWGPVGASIYAQWVTKDVNGGTVDWAFSPTLQMIIK